MYMLGKIICFMKKNFKFIWGIILFSFGVFYIYNSYERIIVSLNVLDCFMIVCTLVLAFLPFVSEISLPGFSLKKEIINTKREMKEAIVDLKYQMIDIKSFTAQSNTQNINLEYLPSKEQLSDEISKIEESKEKDNIKEKNVEPENEINVSEDVIYLFKVRFILEQYVNDILNRNGYRNTKPIYERFRILYSEKLIIEDTYKYLQQVINICNRSIHGEVISKEYIEFVKKAVPTILNQLKQIDRRLERFFSCPKCKYVGNSEYDNVCPKCGFVSDDE